MRRIFDDFQIVTPRDQRESDPYRMDARRSRRLDRPRTFLWRTAFGAPPRCAPGLMLKVPGIDIDKNRLRAEISEHLGSRGKSKRSGDNLIAGFDSRWPTAQGAARRCNARVAGCFAPIYCANSASKRFALGPVVIHPDRSTVDDFALFLGAHRGADEREFVASLSCCSARGWRTEKQSALTIPLVV